MSERFCSPRHPPTMTGWPQGGRSVKTGIARLQSRASRDLGPGLRGHGRSGMNDLPERVLKTDQEHRRIGNHPKPPAGKQEEEGTRQPERNPLPPTGVPGRRLPARDPRAPCALMQKQAQVARLAAASCRWALHSHKCCLSTPTLRSETRMEK